MNMILARPFTTHWFCESDVNYLVFCEDQRFGQNGIVSWKAQYLHFGGHSFCQRVLWGKFAKED